MRDVACKSAEFHFGDDIRRSGGNGRNAPGKASAFEYLGWDMIFPTPVFGADIGAA